MTVRARSTTRDISFALAGAAAATLPAAGLLHAQGQTPVKPPVESMPPFIEAAGPVMSGADVGIRLMGDTSKNRPVHGRLVVRLNGQWVDVALSSDPTTRKLSLSQ